MSNSQFLHKIADVLEAVADEKSKLASELSLLKEAERKKQIAPLVDKLSFVGSDGLEEKLSSLDDSTLELLSKVAGSEAPQLGGSHKVASWAGGTVKQADSDFASWILS